MARSVRAAFWFESSGDALTLGRLQSWGQALQAGCILALSIRWKRRNEDLEVSSGGISESLTHAGVEYTNPRGMTFSSRTAFHIKDDCGDQDGLASNPSGIIHCEADKSTCEAYIQDPPSPYRKLMELILPWRDNDWQLQGRLVYLNKKKCQHLPIWFNSAEKSYHASMHASAAAEFCAAVKQAMFLVEECSHSEWLLKAVELWECTEHFIEVLLDLCWSAYITSLGVGNIEQSEKWMSDVDELLNSRSERNDMAKLLYERYNEIDRSDLDEMVCAKLMDNAVEVDSAEHQLAHLLQDRLQQQTSWQPPFLKRHSFYIYSDFVVPLQSSSKAGANGAILKFPWVYEKEFAMKMRHPKDALSGKTFKREFDILDKYRSPFIVGVVGYWEVEAGSMWNLLTRSVYLCPFLLMENLECDLKDLIDRCRSSGEGIKQGFSVLETIHLMLPIAKALRFLHGKDVAHRDVKSQNIMCKNVSVPEDPENSIVKENTIVKLIDFGEARENVSGLSRHEWGRAGTLGYMDPTMWEADVVGYTLFMGDVFSFAIVFTELLTWRSPVEAFGVASLCDAQAKLKAGGRPPLPPSLPKYVRFIVESCWCADHLKRPDFKAICLMLQHAKMDMEFANELDEIFSYEDATGGRCCISDET